MFILIPQFPLILKVVMKTEEVLIANIRMNEWLWLVCYLIRLPLFKRYYIMNLEMFWEYIKLKVLSLMIQLVEIWN